MHGSQGRSLLYLTACDLLGVLSVHVPVTQHGRVSAGNTEHAAQPLASPALRTAFSGMFFLAHGCRLSSAESPQESRTSLSPLPPFLILPILCV